MKTVPLLFVTAVAVIAGAVSTSVAKEKAKPATSAQAKLIEPHFASRGKPSAAYGEKVFVEYCAVCHGLHGQGDGPRTAFFSDQQYIPDLTVDGFLDKRDNELLTAVREGLARYDKPAIVMPQFKYILGETEIRSVIAYVKTLTVREKKR
jgi:mono/diheme cytochrome c family protein